MTADKQLETALLALREGDVVGAETMLRAVLAQQPEQPRALMFLGVALSRQERWDEAEAILQRGCEVEPISPLMHYNLGRLHQRRERLEDAAACYRQALQLDPRHEGAREGLRQIAAVRPELEYTDQPLGPEQQIRYVETGSVLRAALGLGLVCALVTIGVAVLLAMLLFDESYLLAGVLAGVVLLAGLLLCALAQAGAYNYTASRLQPITIEIEPVGRWYKVVSVEPYPCGRLGAVLGLTTALVCGGVLLPLGASLVAVVMAVAHSAHLSTAVFDKTDVGPIVLVIGLLANLVLLGGGYLLGLLGAVLYNRAAAHWGGLRFQHRWRRGRSELARVHPGHAAVTLTLASLPFWWPLCILLGAILLSKDFELGLEWLVVPTFGVPLALLATAAMYNACAAGYGGICADLRED